MTTQRHVVLAGDSIFDNDVYVPGEPGVLDQLKHSLPPAWIASKVAVDGNVIDDVRRQVKNLRGDVTDLIVSVGGNDALGYSSVLEGVSTPDDLTGAMREPLVEFRGEYAEMLEHLAPISVTLKVCTIYTAIPFDNARWRTFAPLAVAKFNDVILSEAGARGVQVLRLDHICTEASDYSALSPIEPSAKGGQKIVDLIVASLS